MKISKVIRYLTDIQRDVGDVDICYLADDQNGFIDIHLPEVLCVTGVTDQMKDGKPVLHCAFLSKDLLKQLPDETLVERSNLQ